MAAIADRLRPSGGFTRSTLIGWALAALVLLGPLMITSERWMRVLILVLIYCVLASGLNLLVGHAGLLDLGYIAFFAVGAYYASIITVKVAIDGLGLSPESLWWLFLVNLVMAGLFTAGVGVVLGYPTLRARGDYLAIMTLAFGEVVRLLAINWTSLTNGPIGIRGVPVLEPFGFELVDPLYLYYVALAIAGVALFLIHRMVASYIGRAWNAIRVDELAARCMGVASQRYKLLAYASGAFLAGVIGVFFAHLQQFINPDSFPLEENLLVLALVILGGAGTLWGPVVGASIWIIFQEWAGDLGVVAEYPELRMVALALLILVVIRFLPHGIVRSRQRLGFGRPAEEERLGEETPAERREGDPELSPSAPSTGPVLRADGVGVSFGGVRALDGVSLEIQRGELLGLIGPNGAGKSTLFNALSGVVARDSGTLEVAGAAVGGEGPDRIAERGVSRTFQTLRLIGEMTVVENLLVGAHRSARTNVLSVIARTRRARRAEARAREEVERAMRILGVPAELADRRVESLTYFEQRRVELARAIVGHPQVVLIDEPAAGLNIAETKDFGDLIRSIASSGIAVVLIEHDMSLLMSISDRVVVLDQGTRIASGSPEEIRGDERVIKAYLGAAA